MAEQATVTSNEVVRRWQRLGGARRWVEERGGQWGHDDWLALLHQLQRRGPVGPAELGLVLEETRQRLLNLQRWSASGEAHVWVEARRGRWSEDDWQALLAQLQRSVYWPLDLAQVRELIEDLGGKWRNLERWLEAGEARLWVAMHQGAWGHDDWLDLLAGLEEAGVWPIDPGMLGRALEAAKARYWGLRRWVDAGGAREWVEARRGVWSADDWRELLAALERSGVGPVDPAALGLELEEARRRYWNLLNWLATGEARLWVRMHRGRWGHSDWLALLDGLSRSGWWPLDPVSVGQALERLREEYDNLRRWKESDEPRLWVEERRGRWSQAEWLALLERLRRSAYWPMPPEGVARVLEGLQQAA